MDKPVPTQVVRGEIFFDDWQKLSQKRILQLFKESRSWESIRKYVAQANLSRNEFPIIMWLDWVYSDSYPTIRLYSRYAVDLLNYLKMDCDKVGEYDIKAYLNHLSLEGIKEGSYNTILSALKSFFGFMVDKELTDKNPARLLKKKKNKINTKKLKTFGQKEIHQIWRYAEENVSLRDQLLLKLLYYCGLRREELGKLTWSDLHLWQDRWHLRIQGKGNKIRQIFVPSMAMSVIWRYREHLFHVSPEEPAPGINQWPIISSTRNFTKPISGQLVYTVAQKHVLAALGKQASPHWFRHSFCTHLAMLGVRVEQIKAAAGHERIDTTMQYINIANESRAAGLAFERNGFAEHIEL